MQSEIIGFESFERNEKSVSLRDEERFDSFHGCSFTIGTYPGFDAVMSGLETAFPYDTIVLCQRFIDVRV